MTVGRLLERNRQWSRRVRDTDPDFFPRLARQQAPQYLWIGCSDSRVAANQILDLAPGEVFTHRNIANVVSSGDLNGQSVLQFAIDVLQVRHIMVVGHYGCAGVRAALSQQRMGLVDTWLRHVHAVRDQHQELLEKVPSPVREDVMCELNVLAQFSHTCQSLSVLDAWRRGQPVQVHGLIYGLRDGILRDLGLSAESLAQAQVARTRFLRSLRLPSAEQALTGDIAL